MMVFILVFTLDMECLNYAKNRYGTSQNNWYQYGYIWFTGATVGYQWKIKEKWLLDLF